MSARDATAAGVLSALGVLLMLILLPMTWKKVEYYQAVRRRPAVGLRGRAVALAPARPPRSRRRASVVGRTPPPRRADSRASRRDGRPRPAAKSTGKVWRDEVYEAGRYGIGPDYTVRCYPLNVQNFNERLSVWSKSSGSDAGSTVYLDVSYQYLLNPEKLGELYSMVALIFEGLVASRTQDAIRNTHPWHRLIYRSGRSSRRRCSGRPGHRGPAHGRALVQLRTSSPRTTTRARASPWRSRSSPTRRRPTRRRLLWFGSRPRSRCSRRERRGRCREESHGLGLEDQGNAVTEADEKVEVARLQDSRIYDELGFTSEKHKAS